MIGSRYSHWMILLAVVSVLWLAFPAFADPAPATPSSTPTVGSCAAYPGLTNKIASCLRAQIDTAAAQYFTKFYDFVKKPIMAMMTLVVILYGILMAYGMVERVGRDSVILLFKIAVVFGFVNNSQMLYDKATQMMDATAATVVMFTPPSGAAIKGTSGDVDISQATCLQKMRKLQEDAGGATGKVVGPWLGIDCLLDKVIGIKMPEDSSGSVKWYDEKIDETQKNLERGYLYLFFSGMQTSILGVVFAVIGFVFLYGLLMMIIKAFFTYMAGYMGVAFMIVISPLFIPLILHSKTQEYFNKWVKQTLGFAIQPIIMMAFIGFSLAAIDFAAFSGDYSIMYKIAGDKSRENGFNFNKYMTAPRDPATGAETTASATTQAIISEQQRTFAKIKAATTQQLDVLSRDQGGLVSLLAYSKCSDANIKADPALEAKCKSYPIKASYSGLNWKVMAAARTSPAVTGTTPEEKGQQIANEVLAASLFCAVVAFIMNGLLGIIPFIAYDLLGDAMQTPNLGKLMGNLKDKP